MHRSLVHLALVGALAAPLLAGCSAGQEGGGEDVATLKQDLRELTKNHERLTAKLEKLERKVSGNSEDIDRLAHQALETDRVARADVAATPDDDPAASMESAATALAQGGDALAALLETEKGQEVVEKAMAAAQEKRDQARRDAMVSGMVDRFAERAELTPDQTVKVRDIASRSMERMGDIWRSFRDMRDLPEEERATARADNMAKMQDIRDEANEEVKAVLNSAQYLIYEEEMANRFGGGGGFGGRRGGDRGGR